MPDRTFGGESFSVEAQSRLNVPVVGRDLVIVHVGNIGECAKGFEIGVKFSGIHA